MLANGSSPVELTKLADVLLGGPTEALENTFVGGDLFTNDAIEPPCGPV